MNRTVLEVVKWSEPRIENFSSENAVNIAQVEYQATGWLNGILTSTYMIHYTAYDPQKPYEAQSTFTGYTRFYGEMNGKKGSVVLVETGEHDDGLVSNLTIKPNTAKDGLAGLEGKGQYKFEKDQIVLLTDF